MELFIKCGGEREKESEEIEFIIYNSTTHKLIYEKKHRGSGCKRDNKPLSCLLRLCGFEYDMESEFL